MDRLIEAGLKVFGRKGLKAARMSDVAKELEVSQGTLYNYVESKEALFCLLVERGGGEHEDRTARDSPRPVRHQASGDASGWVAMMTKSDSERVSGVALRFVITRVVPGSRRS